jgi:hypothetical protein
MTPLDLQAKRSAASLVVMLDWAAQFGLSAQRCLAGTRTTRAAVRSPAAEVSGQQELRAITNILAALGNRPGLGLQAAALTGLVVSIAVGGWCGHPVGHEQC